MRLILTGFNAHRCGVARTSLIVGVLVVAAMHDGGPAFGGATSSMDQPPTVPPLVHQVDSRDERLGLRPIPWPRKSIWPQSDPDRGMTQHPVPPHHRRPVVHKPAHMPAPAGSPERAPASPEPARMTTPSEPLLPSVPIVTIEPRVIPPPAAAPPAAAPAPVVPRPPVVATPNADTPDVVRARATELMKIGQVLAARRILSARPLGDDPLVIAALGETYDPLVLEAYPKLKGAADVQRAMELYLLAVSKGNTDALKRIAALEALNKK